MCTAEKSDSNGGHDWHFHTYPWSVSSRHNMRYFGLNPMKEGDFLTYPPPIIKQAHQVMNTTWDAHMTPHSSGGAGGSGIQQGLKLVKSIWWFTLLVKFHAWQCLKVPLICSLRFDNIWKRTWCKSEVKLTELQPNARKSKFLQILHLMWKWTDDLAIVLTFEICKVAMRTRKRGPWIKTRWLH